jgi:hypothetical protein
MLEDFPINDKTIRQMEMDMQWEAYKFAKGLSTDILTEDLKRQPFKVNLLDYAGYGPTGEDSTTILLSGTETITICTPFKVIEYLWNQIH